MSAMVKCGRCRLWQASPDAITGRCLYKYPSKYVAGVAADEVISTLPTFQCPHGKPLLAKQRLCTVPNGK